MSGATMMPKYEFAAERWLRSNADLYERKGNQQMARNIRLCADEIHRLRMADDLNQQGAEHMREELARVRAELAALVRGVKRESAAFDALSRAKFQLDPLGRPIWTEHSEARAEVDRLLEEK